MTAPEAMPEPVIDRELLLRRRRRASERFHEHNALLVRAADDLVDRVSLVQRRFQSAAVIGPHQDLVRRAMARLPNNAGRPVLGVECGPALADAAFAVLADEEALPLADGAFDLVVSSLALQFVNDLPGCLVQIRRALQPDGLFMASVLGGESLRELRDAWLMAESERLGGASPRVAPFADVRTLGNLLSRAGFALPVADLDTITVTYPSPLALMREIKALGASNMLSARSRMPVTRSFLCRTAEIYAAHNSLENGRVTATFEVISLTGWCPDPSQQQPFKPGSAQTRLIDVLPKPAR